MAKESVGGIGDFNSYGSGRFAHPNIDLGEPKEREILGGRHIFNALSEIQRYHVIEDRSDEIPKEYFTIEQIIDYLKIGFKKGEIKNIWVNNMREQMLNTIFNDVVLDISRSIFDNNYEFFIRKINKLLKTKDIKNINDERNFSLFS